MPEIAIPKPLRNQGKVLVVLVHPLLGPHATSPFKVNPERFMIWSENLSCLSFFWVSGVSVPRPAGSSTVSGTKKFNLSKFVEYLISES